MALFVKLVLLLCFQIPVLCAVTPVFVKKGDDVLLDITEADLPEKVTILSWKFSPTDDVLVSFVPGLNPKIEDEYADRVELSVKKYSVKLKNLQKSDSGVYVARLIGDQEKILTEYTITVQDPVSPVRMTVDSVSNSSDGCNITVTCSTEESSITSAFICNTTTCHQKGKKLSKITTAGASFQVYLSNKLIICNHSNQVSWAKKDTEILDFCPQHVGSENLFGISICLLKTVVFSVGLVIMVSAVISVHIMEKLKKQN